MKRARPTRERPWVLAVEVDGVQVTFRDTGGVYVDVAFGGWSADVISTTGPGPGGRRPRFSLSAAVAEYLGDVEHVRDYIRNMPPGRAS